MAQLAEIGKQYVFDLPSKLLRVRARRPSLLTILASGGFPNELTAAAWRSQNGTVDFSGENPQLIRQLAQLIDAILSHVLVSPAVGLETRLEEGPDGVAAGTVAVVDLPDVDKQFLFMWAQRLLPTPGEEAPPALDNFRDERARVDARSAGTAVQPATVGTGGADSG